MTQAALTLLGSVGWGLLACGAVTHVWHHARLRSLLGRHFDHERLPALALAVVEVALVVGIVVAVRLDSTLLRVLALSATLLALVFMAWIARLLVTGSDLPCACSFSDAPTTWWSFGRSVCVGLVACFLLVDHQTYVAEVTASETVATLLVGWAVGAAIFVLPEAISWPQASRALLARVDAHANATETLTSGQQ